ncbi:hypothetical protein OSB52_03810 [Gordonia sp. SW 21]|uniref:Uncharacterized protein n=1 Tax=Gordonia aquimaris TaxID=2984863 RepID=A0A9X3D1Q4_9ACTN|nr:hypothetical protein [Gordonia aquimaris]MCX2963213.1 hypothetical protein [Gordonia aquimaris]
MRNRDAVSFSRFNGVTALTCEPPPTRRSRAGRRTAVTLATSDIVPAATHLFDTYDSFGDVQAACEQFMLEIQ